MTDIANVTQADRMQAFDWNMECRHCSEYEGDYEADLAQAFARHRHAAMLEGARLMQEAAILKAHELYPTMEVAVMLLHLDPAQIIKGCE